MLSHMSSFSHGIMDALDVLFSASRVAGAIERGARPDAHDLNRLGIETASFAAIHRV